MGSHCPNLDTFTTHFPARHLAIKRQYFETLSLIDAHGAEMALIEGKNVGNGVALCEHDDRSVGEPNLKICVSLDHFPGPRNIGGPERLQLVCPSRDFLQQSRLRGVAYVARQQTIQFG